MAGGVDRQTVTAATSAVSSGTAVPEPAAQPQPAGASRGVGSADVQPAADNGEVLLAPAWRFITGVASVLNLSEENIKTLMRHVHKAVKPYLTADLLGRHPGEFASIDHTFRLAIRSIGDATAYAFFLGEDHTIFWHGAVGSTSYDDLLYALQGCERRFVRLGVSGQLKYVWDDLCCAGKPAEQMHKHVVVDTFPNVERCPFKDGFHATQLVTSTFNSGTGEVDVFSRKVGRTLRKPLEKDIRRTARFLMADEQLNETEARREAQTRFRGDGIIRTFGPPPDELESAWDDLIEDFRAVSIVSAVSTGKV
jgi:hypothetical protein